MKTFEECKKCGKSYGPDCKQCNKKKLPVKNVPPSPAHIEYIPQRCPSF